MKKIRLIQEEKQKLVEENFQEFVRSCKVKNLSEKTIIYYEMYMGKFLKYLNSCQISYTQELSKKVVEDYILFLKDRYKPVTVNTSIRGVRAVIYYFQSLGYCSTFKINLIRYDKEVKEAYTHAELKKLLARPKTNEFYIYRNWVLVNFFLATGVRVGEVVNIRVSDLDLEEAMVKIKKGKSRRERQVPLSKSLVRILSEYLELRHPTSETDYLFCNVYGNKLQVNSCKHTIARYNEMRGVIKTSIHLFRHTFAKMFILNGGDIFRLQKILGHRSIEVVREYVNMFNQDVQLDFDKFNPLEQMNSSSVKIRF